MLSLALALPRRVARWWRAFTRWLRIGDPVDPIGADAVDGAAEGFIGVALVCAHTGAAITRAAAMAVPLNRCFIASSPELDYGCRDPKGDAGLPHPASPSGTARHSG